MFGYVWNMLNMLKHVRIRVETLELVLEIYTKLIWIKSCSCVAYLVAISYMAWYNVHICVRYDLDMNLLFICHENWWFGWYVELFIWKWCCGIITWHMFEKTQTMDSFGVKKVSFENRILKWIYIHLKKIENLKLEFSIQNWIEMKWNNIYKSFVKDENRLKRFWQEMRCWRLKWVWKYLWDFIWKFE